MAVNYAEKYSEKIDERFTLVSQTTSAVNNDYDFVGVKTVKVYSIPTAEMNDYTRSGGNRYGTPAELEDSIQELTMRQDRSFTFTIDRGNHDDQMMVKNAGEALNRQITEVIVPEVDKYRLGVMAANAGKSKTAAITSAYDALLDASVALTDNKVPMVGRIAFVTPSFYKLIKLDPNFVKASDVAQGMLITGSIGTVDGMNLIVVPQSYMPENTAFIVTHPVATTAPVKLSEYKIHDNPPGINGWLVEGRVYYDAFVLNNKKNAVYVHKTA